MYGPEDQLSGTDRAPGVDTVILKLGLASQHMCRRNVTSYRIVERSSPQIP